MNNWHGLVKILEIQHIRNNEVIWESKNIYNMLHNEGEKYVLDCCFNNPGTFPPANYYFGLDNRNPITAADLIEDIVDEPVGSGYLRATVGSSGQFTVDVFGGVYRATGQIVTFSATGAGWGPVSSLFLTTKNDDTGILIASAPLSNTITMVGGDAINLRMALALRDVS